MSPARRSMFRSVAASFAAGAGAVALLVSGASVIADGGLALTAHASELEQQGPAVAPLDLAAIEAQLEQADAAMNSTQSRTHRAIARLERLSH